MKVFVSWSGERGRVFAEAVCDLLASTTGDARLEPWMSTRIRHGKPWAIELLGQLTQCRACVVCLTADTVASRWLAFEAGAVLGAGANPDHVVGLGLDLDPGMLHGHTLARFETFDASNGGVRALWRRLRPGSEPAWPASSWQGFEAACAAVPDPAVRTFTLWVCVPNGLFAHPIEGVHDMPFDDVLTQLLGWHGEEFDAATRQAFRCIDFDAGAWLPMPRRISLIGQQRLAVLHPEAFREYGESALGVSVALRESIDVIPKVNTALAVLNRDLRDLLITQRAYHNAHGRYAGNLDDLDFIPTPGNHLHVIAGEHGFAAQGRCDAAPSVYGVRVGDGAGNYLEMPEGEVFLASV